MEHIVGYYVDLEATPIGGRPVYSRYVQGQPAFKPGSKRKHLSGAKFECRQPFWCKKCM